MKKIYHLSTCNTCQRIIKDLELNEHGFEFQDIKEKNIEPEVLDHIADFAGGYEQVFSKRAMKFRAMGLHEIEMKEEDYRKYILEEYTFLKRPVILIGELVFVGNSKKTIADAAEALKK